MKWLLSLSVVVLLHGCETLKPAPDPLPVTDGVMADAVNAASAPAAEQKLALGRAQQAYAKEPTTVNRLRLGILLAALPAPLRDDARAVELLEPLSDASAPGAGRVAALLLLQIAERQQLEALRSIERGVLEREERLRKRQK